jgi:hypothetical protein
MNTPTTHTGMVMAKQELDSKKKRMNVTLDDSTKKKLKEIGLGNISMGIRLAAKDYKLKR